MATTIKSRFPLLLLLGIIFLASVCVTYANYDEGREPSVPGQRERGRQEGEKEEKRHGEWRPSPEKEEDEEEKYKYEEGRVPGQRERGRQEGEKEEKRHGEWRPSEEDEEEKYRYEEGSEPRGPGQRETGRQEGEKEEQRRERHPQWESSYEKEEDEEEKQKYQYHREKKEQTEVRPGRERFERHEDEEQWRGIQRHEDPEERARERYRAEIAKRQVEEEREERDIPREREQRNPFLFKSNKFQTLFQNENGYIRRLQRFDKRSDLFENLQNYRLVEYRAKPHTIFLPQHIDADLILVVLSGRAILTVLSPNDRNSYNLERGDTIKLPAGTTSYLVNQDDEEDLRVVDLAIPVNRPGKVESYLLSGNKNQYLRGFSKNILEASFNTNYETIERVLLEEQDKESQQSIGQKRRSQRQETNALVKVSREQIEELKRLAKSSSEKGLSSQFEPINLRSHNPKYSNKFGKLFEITPEKKYPELQDLDLFVSSVDIEEGALMLPHYNSRAIVLLLVNEGRGNLELVGLKNEQQEQEERNNQLQRYEARLSPGDVVIIPAGHPVTVSASSNLNLLGFGINGENNRRNFLAGSDDNVINQIENPVKELTFPGSAREVNRLLKNQEHSHFASQESQRKRSPLSSILNA
ncbi:convicilin-like [Vicia villosa]|uniref:convicilin-like n=1 Tax=Vicia villosa TaxID=3911 RepID=UPI00273CD6D8|nr:convicilin-like [Vicia villosa]